MIINAIIRLLLIFKYYRIAGNFDFGKLEIFFCGWRTLIWRIGGHMSLSMCIVDEIVEFNFSEW